MVTPTWQWMLKHEWLQSWSPPVPSWPGPWTGSSSHHYPLSCPCPQIVPLLCSPNPFFYLKVQLKSYLFDSFNIYWAPTGWPGPPPHGTHGIQFSKGEREKWAAAACARDQGQKWAPEKLQELWYSEPPEDLRVPRRHQGLTEQGAVDNLVLTDQSNSARTQLGRSKSRGTPFSEISDISLLLTTTQERRYTSHFAHEKPDQERPVICPRPQNIDVAELGSS